MDELITWEKIRNIHRDEKASQKLTKLPDDFFERVQDYIGKKGSVSTGYEFENIKKISEELINIRLKKILTLLSYGLKVENLTQREKSFFDDVSKIVNEFKSQIPKKEIQAESQQPQNILQPEVRAEKITLKPNKTLIKIVDDVPEFVGLDLKDYALRAGDIITIHKEIADLLVRSGKAEYIGIE
jgi:DNA replication initiation complex subunit (GINS family)